MSRKPSQIVGTSSGPMENRLKTSNGKPTANPSPTNAASSLPLSPETILKDYTIALQSREASLIGRREVLSGKAKFGIFGDGKEMAQLAMAHAFRKGDFRSGYYRDQTVIFALGLATMQEFFAQLYADTDLDREPHSGGRQMNGHFATRSLNPDGSWKNLTEMFNTSADMSPTGSQMPRLVGLAQASKLYRELEELHHLSQFSRHGDEIAFGTIGNASCAEGMFWESVNAIGVLKVPAVISIWDDGYGISVSNEFQITKQNLSELLKGFQREPGGQAGFDLYTVRGWDYPALVETYAKAAETARREHVPALIHVIEVTQPQGHSTSGSHERYKSAERLQWEVDFDCNKRMREWLIAQRIATPGQLHELEEEAKQVTEEARTQAWEAYNQPIRQERDEVVRLLRGLEATAQKPALLAKIRQGLHSKQTLYRRDVLTAVHEALLTVQHEDTPARQALIAWKKAQEPLNHERYSAYLYSQSKESALLVKEVKPVYSASSPVVNGFQVMNACFDAMLQRDPRVVAFGEDVGQLGDVNQGLAGMQAKYGALRVSDTGIRETTIIGQAIGLALRGLRPIAEIQYLDYVLYALQIMSDDLATLHWRTCGGQKAPAIIRTRGHRLEGVWHSGSPMAAIIHLLRGMHICVPRDMTRAAGFYNTLLLSDEPGMVVEVLNGYRQKETLPDNIGELTLPLGVPEIIREGEDVTIVTYGASCRIALEAAEMLAKVKIEAEVVDVQTLLPFDVNGRIVESLKKTNRILFLDEDVPGGTSAYMFQEVIEKQGGYHWLDAEPRTLAAQAHRPAYGTDGNHFSKPNAEDVFTAVYELMYESDPATYPLFYK